MLKSVDSALNYLLSVKMNDRLIETVSLTGALGRVTSSPVFSAIDVPLEDNSAMDGFALRFEDLTKRDEFPLSARIPAGCIPKPLKPETAVRIFTGAHIPEGADVVIPQEHAEYDEKKVKINRGLQKGANIRKRGEDICKDSEVIPQGHLLRPQDLGLIASVGINRLEVYQKLKVAVFFTGDELIEPGNPLPAGKLYNSNRYSILALLAQSGVETVDLGNVGDSLSNTQDALIKAANHADVVITTGGVSVGEEDYVRTAVENTGSLNLWRIAMKPGKPLAFGEINNAYFFGLPGNPVSSFITFLIFVRPFMLRLQGVKTTDNKTFKIAAGFEIPRTSARREYARARIARDDNAQLIKLLPFQGSGVLSSLRDADGLVIIPENSSVKPGDKLTFIPCC